MEKGMLVAVLESAIPVPDVDLYSPDNLAYIGDTVFDLIVRTGLLKGGNRPVNRLNSSASRMVRASAQSDMYRFLADKLPESELAVMRRGRNANTRSRAKNASVIDYRQATGVEALFGYLYLKGEFERIIEIYNLYIDRIQKDEECE